MGTREVEYFLWPIKIYKFSDGDDGDEGTFTYNIDPL
jgi:hypothetical protein